MRLPCQLVYYWLMELREQVNYRERAFQEPSQCYFFHKLFHKVQARNQIDTYIEEEKITFV